MSSDNNKKHLKDFIMDVKDMTNELGISEATQCAWRLRNIPILLTRATSKAGLQLSSSPVRSITATACISSL